MQREVRKLMFDIKQSGELIETFVAGVTFERYQQDRMVQSAVERQFEIIGEALRNALDIEPSLERRLTTPRRIIAFRNRLVHGYASVSAAVVWGVVESHLPVLLKEIEALLQEE